MGASRAVRTLYGVNRDGMWGKGPGLCETCHHKVIQSTVTNDTIYVTDGDHRTNPHGIIRNNKHISCWSKKRSGGCHNSAELCLWYAHSGCAEFMHAAAGGNCWRADGRTAGSSRRGGCGACRTHAVFMLDISASCTACCQLLLVHNLVMSRHMQHGPDEAGRDGRQSSTAQD
jgi:hypothetical protein